MERIIPSADLRRNYSDVSRLCHEERRPVIVTVNGRGDTVILGIQEYEQMKAELELLRMLSEAEEDVSQGHIAPMRETFDEIRKSLLREKSE